MATLLLLTRELRHRWGELLLTGALIAAVVAVLGVQRVASSASEESVHGLAHRLGKNMLVVPASVDLADVHQLKYGDAALPAEYVARLQESALAQHIRLVSPSLRGEADFGGVRLLVVGNDDWVAPPSLSSGSAAILGEEAARRLQAKPGDRLHVAGQELSVEEVSPMAPEGLDAAVFVPLATAQTLLGKPGALNVLRLGGCWCSVDVPTLGRQVEQLLPGTRAVTVAGVLQAQKGSIAQVQRYSTVLHVAGVGLIVAMVAALGVAHVRRHRREIGLLLAAGLPPSQIALQFVLKAALTALLAAAGGCAATGWVAGVAGAALLPLPLVATPAAALTGALWALGAAVVASLVPALRAARLEPVVALRED